MTESSPINFIQELKSEHRSIVATLHDIDTQEGSATEYKSSIEKLNKITDMFFGHLEKEDQYLYPTLIASNHTVKAAKKYSYDMERLTCIGLEFFKRYCINKEGLKIFAEDFVNAYSIFRGLLKLRIKREETELYPLFILLESGALRSDVLDYVKEQEHKNHDTQKQVFVFGENRSYVEALTLAIEMAGHKSISTHTLSNVLSRIESTDSKLILIDTTKPNAELKDLIHQLKKQINSNVQIIGFANDKSSTINADLQDQFDGFIAKPTLDIEKFSKTINKLVNQ